MIAVVNWVMVQAYITGLVVTLTATTPLLGALIWSAIRQWTEIRTQRLQLQQHDQQLNGALTERIDAEIEKVLRAQRPRTRDPATPRSPVQK